MTILCLGHWNVHHLFHCLWNWNINLSRWQPSLKHHQLWQTIGFSAVLSPREIDMPGIAQGIARLCLKLCIKNGDQSRHVETFNYRTQNIKYQASKNFIVLPDLDSVYLDTSMDDSTRSNLLNGPVLNSLLLDELGDLRCTRRVLRLRYGKTTN